MRTMWQQQRQRMRTSLATSPDTASCCLSVNQPGCCVPRSGTTGCPEHGCVFNLAQEVGLAQEVFKARDVITGSTRIDTQY
jgi:hypothetical protein